MQLRSSHAHEEGGKREWSVSTTEFVGQNGHVDLRAQRVVLEGGRFVPVPGSEFELKADLVLLAMGFTGADTDELRDFMTARRGVFTSGDARLGAC